jgi:hypothetical protein
MKYEYWYPRKKEEGNLLAKIQYIVFEIYILSIRFQNILFVCEYQLKPVFFIEIIYSRH